VSVELLFILSRDVSSFVLLVQKFMGKVDSVVTGDGKNNRVYFRYKYLYEKTKDDVSLDTINNNSTDTTS